MATKHFATLQFDVPNIDGPTSDERAIFIGPAAKQIVHERVELHDMRTSVDIVKDGAGLDAQGFTYINHQSALKSTDDFITGRNIEDIYLPELESLLCKITGAKKAVVSNVFFRLTDREVPSGVVLRDEPLGKALASIPRDGLTVMGRKDGEQSLPAARAAHCDYSIRGLRDSVRYCRDDITAVARPSIEAEDAGATPRYAAYSLWRPLKTIRRDPLAVCDSRTLDKNSELATIDYACLSNVTENGEYLMHGLMGLPPQQPNKQKWYWLPEHRPDELLIIKFADTASEHDPDIASCCLHLSPQVEGTANEEARNSIEARVFAFW